MPLDQKTTGATFRDADYAIKWPLDTFRVGAIQELIGRQHYGVYRGKS